MLIQTDNVDQASNVHQDILPLTLQNHAFKHAQKDILKTTCNKLVIVAREDVVLVQIHLIVLYAIMQLPFGSNFNVTHSVLL